MSADAFPQTAAPNPGGWGKDPAVVAARLRRVAYLTGRGWTRREIADDLGLSIRTVAAYRRRAREAGGVPAAMCAAGLTQAQAAAAAPRGPRYAAAAAGRVRELYGAGCSQARVAAELGVAKSTVWLVMRRHGIPARGSGPRS